MVEAKENDTHRSRHHSSEPPRISDIAKQHERRHYMQRTLETPPELRRDDVLSICLLVSYGGARRRLVRFICFKPG
jgi:hypothetical protein